jgi:hypothetical protein
MQVQTLVILQYTYRNRLSHRVNTMSIVAPGERTRDSINLARARCRYATPPVGGGIISSTPTLLQFPMHGHVATRGRSQGQGDRTQKTPGTTCLQKPSREAKNVGWEDGPGSSTLCLDTCRLLNWARYLSILLVPHSIEFEVTYTVNKTTLGFRSEPFTFHIIAPRFPFHGLAPRRTRKCPPTVVIPVVVQARWPELEIRRRIQHLGERHLPRVTHNCLINTGEYLNPAPLKLLQPSFDVLANARSSHRECI